ncbi:hypothetical protein [Stenotrophomonas sp. Iso1]|uniref:hypothetical protein n=1 Tax=Stenotrophomonas sp. Iso1 TaxID=2977283 RepID=UPI0022B7752C|nr:hypothetical protein [Stenotrophomonas sp. Iso1]
MSSVIQTYPHWTYFLCLEDDISTLSRWVEFSEPNYGCYSVEIARLLMAAAAEVDVVAKLVCKSINAGSKASSIGSYQAELMAAYPTLPMALTTIPRFGIELRPWTSWATPASPPVWWTATNKVKHHRSEHFDRATLISVLEAMGALLILLTLLYKDRMNQLEPLSRLFVPKSFLLNMGDNRVRFTHHA